MKKNMRLAVVCGIVFASSLCISTLSAYAEGGTAPIYLTQETAKTTDETVEDASNPKTYDEGIQWLLVIMVISLIGLAGSIVRIKKDISRTGNEKGLYDTSK